MTHYDAAASRWLRNHPGRAISQYQINALFNEAYMKSANMLAILNGFRCTGIWPCNRDIFEESDYAVAEVFSNTEGQEQGHECPEPPTLVSGTSVTTEVHSQPNAVTDVLIPPAPCGSSSAIYFPPAVSATDIVISPQTPESATPTAVFVPPSAAMTEDFAACIPVARQSSAGTSIPSSSAIDTDVVLVDSLSSGSAAQTESHSAPVAEPDLSSPSDTGSRGIPPMLANGEAHKGHMASEKIIETFPDGRCLFRSLSHCIGSIFTNRRERPKWSANRCYDKATGNNRGWCTHG